MKFARWMVVFLLCSTMVAAAQADTARSTSKRRKAATKTAPKPATAEDLQQLREMMQQQQQQIEELRMQLQQSSQQSQQLQQQLMQAQQAATEAQQKVATTETAVQERSAAIEQAQSDIKDIQGNMAQAALSTQEDQKRVGALETLLNRFRFNGDVRVRYENFYQENVTTRHRARIRLRAGFEGQLNQDFIGGIYMATGNVVDGNPSYRDPVSTNETLTSFFERKTIGFDRGFITYQPQNAKWLQLTGGKFAFTWTRTPLTFDNDLNPEGFSQKLSFKTPIPLFRNITLTGMQLLYNEASAGPDSFAVGGQISTKWQLTPSITITPSYSALNWQRADSIANAANPVAPRMPNTPAEGEPLPTIPSAPARVINANALTNATGLSADGRNRIFLSKFLYHDFILDTNIKTPIAKLPIRLLGEYLQNTRAISNQNDAFWAEASIGQTKNTHDFLAGYGFARIDQDAVISQFVESDLRAPTNVVQHRVFFNYAFSPTVTGNYTLWYGRTLNTSLQNAQRSAGVAAGQQDAWLKRMQFDLVYKF